MPVRYLEDADFKTGINFRKVGAKILYYGHFGSKSIDVLILTKFCLYPIWKMLISNLTLVFEILEPKFFIMGIVGQKVSTF